MRVCELLVFIWFIVLCFDYVTTANFNIKSYGMSNPNGMVKYCSMFTDSTTVNPKSLTKLYLSVIGTDGIATTYDYYHVTNLMSHPDVDLMKKTSVYVGAYMDTSSVPLGDNMAKVYHKLGCNALVLQYMDSNWKNVPIPAAARHIRSVSKHAAEMLAHLTTLGLDPKKLELVGFGLGAQTMSFVAKHYREITGKNISTLIGLDPAGPCFRTLGPKERLDPSDADFVLSVATNIDGFGMATPMGHVTFYVNGGEYQTADVWFMPCGVVCSHIRAYYLWLSALLNPGKFIGVKCDTIQQARQQECFDNKPMVTNTMDLEVDRNKPGIFYLSTDHRYPYAKGKAGISKISDERKTQFMSSSKHMTF